MKVMNVAVVGAGIYGINHVNAYTWNPNTNLVAVCDLNKEITDRIAEQYNVKTYNDVNEMLDNEVWWRSHQLQHQKMQRKF